MYDEYHLAGAISELPDIWKTIQVGWNISGRPVSFLLSKYIYYFVGTDMLRMQAVRFVNVVLLSIFAYALFRLLVKQSKSLIWPFFSVLFLFSQVPLQGIALYGLQISSNFHLAAFFSILAFYLHFYNKHNNLGQYVKSLSICAIFFTIACLINQVYALLFVFPLSSYVLTSEKVDHKKVLGFISCILITFVGLGVLFIQTTQKVEYTYYRTLTAANYLLDFSLSLDKVLFLINPLTYWSAFNVLSIPIPISLIGIDPLVLSIYLSIVTIAFFFAILGTTLIKTFAGITSEGIRFDRFLRFFWVLVCLAFGALVIILDEPEKVIKHRPHIKLILQGVVIFIAADCLKFLTKDVHFKARRIGLILSSIIIFFYICLVPIRLNLGGISFRNAQLNFTRNALHSKNLNSAERIIIFKGNKFKCKILPCDSWFIEHQNKSKELVKYVMASRGIKANRLPIITVNAPNSFKLRPGDLLIDLTIQ